jgi:hypothetical protein
MPEKQTVKRAQRAKRENQRAARPSGITRQVTKNHQRRLGAVPKPVNGCSNAKVIVLRRASHCKNRHAPRRDDGRGPPAQTLPAKQRAPRGARGAQWLLVKRHALARDGNRGEVWTGAFLAIRQSALALSCGEYAPLMAAN